MSVARALAHAIKDGEACRRFDPAGRLLTPDKRRSELKMPDDNELTLEAGEEAKIFIFQKMDQPEARCWRDRMRFKENGDYQQTSSPLGISDMCCLCAVCGKCELMGPAAGKLFGCVVPSNIWDHINTAIHKRNVVVDQALPIREEGGQQK